MQDTISHPNVMDEITEKDKRIAALEAALKGSEESRKHWHRMYEEVRSSAYRLEQIIAVQEPALESIKRVAGSQGSALANMLWKIADAALHRSKEG